MINLNQTKLDQLRQRLQPHPAHLSTILDGVVASFADTGNPLRFTNVATGLRELLRELFAAIAPDANIKRCKWFVPDSTSNNGVSRRHRTQYSVYAYLAPSHFPTNFVAGIDALADAIVAQVGRLSKYTHVTASVFSTPEQIAVNACDDTIDLFLQLFEAIDHARQHLQDALQEELQQILGEMFTSDFFQELDSLSTHTRPQDAEDVEVTVRGIGEDEITFTGTGSVLCDLQYGSDGDCRRGDGLEISDSYPFTFSGKADTDNPRNVSVDRDDVSVDTSSFYE